MQIEKRKVSDLMHDPCNARKHSERNIRSIISSLARFGQQKPIVVDSSGVVRCGNGTLEAASLLGWEEIDCVITELKGTEATAYAIADNRTAELAEWDNEVLVAILHQLSTDDDKLFDASGFNQDELDELMSDWEPDLDAIEKHGENLDGINCKLTIELSKDDFDKAKQSVSDCLDRLGLSYAIK